MNVGRGANQPWEIRLGAVQVVIVSGISAGALIGSYFMGFFAGQTVGFETSRVASSVEVAKLPLGEVAGQEPSTVSEIYAHLQDAALPEVTEPVAKSAGSHKEKGDGGVSPAVKMAQEIASDIPGDAHDVQRGAMNGSRLPEADPAETRMLQEAHKRSRERDIDPEKMPSGGVAKAGVVSPDGTDGLGEDIAQEDVLPKQDVRILGAGKEGSLGERAKETTLGAALEESLEQRGKDGSGKKEVVAKAQTTTTDLGTLPKGNKGFDVAGGSNEPLKKGIDATAREEKSAKVAPIADSPTKVPTPKPSTGLVKRTLPPGHFAQVAAPKKLTDAEDIAKKLKKSGFPVVVEVASIQGVEYFRVLVGPEENKVQAERLIEQLGSERYIPGKPFIRVVK